MAHATLLTAEQHIPRILGIPTVALSPFHAQLFARTAASFSKPGTVCDLLEDPAYAFSKGAKG